MLVIMGESSSEIFVTKNGCVRQSVSAAIKYTN